MRYRTFKVGDKITIRPDLSKHETCPVTGCRIPTNMWRYKGKTTTVMQVVTLGENRAYYRLEVDNNNWSWTSFMFQQPLFKRKELP